MVFFTNSLRPEKLSDTVAILIHNALRLEVLPYVIERVLANAKQPVDISLRYLHLLKRLNNLLEQSTIVHNLTATIFGIFLFSADRYEFTKNHKDKFETEIDDE